MDRHDLHFFLPCFPFDVEEVAPLFVGNFSTKKSWSYVEEFDHDSWEHSHGRKTIRFCL